VAVSDIDIFREIGADAAVYFDPHDPASFAAVIRGLADPGEWGRRSALSRARAADFSWDNSARALLATLNAVHQARSAGGN
jgi:glycosyltransferase involved in cell wall biosynthesis